MAITSSSASSQALPAAGTNACPRSVSFGSSGPAGAGSGGSLSGTPNSGGSGGGGEMDWLLLAAGTAALAVRRSRNGAGGV